VKFSVYLRDVTHLVTPKFFAHCRCAALGIEAEILLAVAGTPCLPLPPKDWSGKPDPARNLLVMFAPANM
jgi:hypothetical protein